MGTGRLQFQVPSRSKLNENTRLSYREYTRDWLLCNAVGYGEGMVGLPKVH